MVKLAVDSTYPQAGPVRIGVGPERPSSFTLRLRIPHWSARTAVKVNGQPVSNVVPGRYLALSRAWKPGDVVELELDMTPRFWAGERECAGLTSIYSGPILLAYDRRFNTIEPADLPALEATGLRETQPQEPVPSMAPIVLVEYLSAGGRAVRLCDFATAGADGSAYRSWLKVDRVSSFPFRRTDPRRSGVASGSPVK
jgi:hypothetical protein